VAEKYMAAGRRPTIRGYNGHCDKKIAAWPSTTQIVSLVESMCRQVTGSGLGCGAMGDIADDQRRSWLAVRTMNGEVPGGRCRVRRGLLRALFAGDRAVARLDEP
jgi:hypothetical protein